jgi:hypothetical protein
MPEVRRSRVVQLTIRDHVVTTATVDGHEQLQGRADVFGQFLIRTTPSGDTTTKLGSSLRLIAPPRGPRSSSGGVGVVPLGFCSPPSSPIEITAEICSESVAISVSDRGMGLHDPEALFKPFWREQQAAATASGLGLGLEVCRTLVEAQGGRMSAAHRRGGGSVFTFTLPRLSESGQRRSRSESTASNAHQNE